MSNRILCKFFAHGACLKGEHCEFSHDWKAEPNNICTFYQRGVCSYGSRCRYDHVKVSHPQTSISSSSTNSHQHLASDSVQVTHPCRTALSGETTKLPSVPAELSALSRPFFPPIIPAWDQDTGDHYFSDDENGGESTITQPADLPICSFAAAGSCPRGERCPQIHGDLCATCGKHCLHPYRPDEREEHMKTCERKSKHLEALKHSQEIECSVCLDRVLSKPSAAERKFGLLSECDHPFCVSCIRNWRSSSPTFGMDVNTALRACPICRKLSHFVIPSVIWYSTKEEKQEIIDSYKAKLRSIDCRYFDFGNGTCPFGTSCFYKHTYKPDTNRQHEYMPHRNRSSCVNTYGETVLFGHIYRPHVLDINDNDLKYLDDDDDDDDDVEYGNLTPEEMAFLLMQLELNMCSSPSDEEN